MDSLENNMDGRAMRKKSARSGRYFSAEKLLYVVAICSFFACVALLIGLGMMVGHQTNCNKTISDKVIKREISSPYVTVKPDVQITNEDSCHEFCSSPICQQEAEFFLNSIDQNIDPCDDFYQFACGGFIKNAIIPDDENKIDRLGITQKKVLGELIEKMREEIKVDELDAFKKLKTYYQNCINESRIEEEGTTKFMKILTDLGGWPVLLGDKWIDTNYTWPEAIYKIRNYGYPIPFPVFIYVAIDPKNTTRNQINILNADTRIRKTFMLGGPESDIMKAYYNYMVDIAVMLGADKDVAIRDMKLCLDFEIELYKIKSSTEELTNTESIHNPVTVKELTEKYPSIPWLKILNVVFNPSNITIDENEVVVLNDPKFLAKFEKLIENTPKRVLSNYLMWHVVYDSIDYLPNTFLDRKQVFLRVLRGIKTRKDRSYSCADEIMDVFTLSLSALYVREYFNLEIRSGVLELVESVKAQFKKILEEVDWMDDETRIAAIEKLKSMDVYVAFSEELFDDQKINDYYKDLQIVNGSYLISAINLSLFYTKPYYGILRQPVDKEDWTSKKNAAIINAYYYLHKNTFEIPAGFLRGSFYHHDRPKYLNYGSIGTIIGHEITHGFDNEGRKSDKDGNHVDWWKASTKEKYIRKAKCIVDQYNKYIVKDINVTLNGERTQGENIADNGGFKAAYRAYDNWIKISNITEPCLSGLNYTSRQMFWISAAGTWCRKQKIEYLRDSIIRDAHSPPDARIIIPFSNIDEFSKDFSCKVGTNMNPIDKCVVW